MKKFFLILLLIALTNTACGQTLTPPEASPTVLPPTATITAIPSNSPSPTPTFTETPTRTATTTATRTQTPIPTSSPAPSQTATLTPIPTYIKLRGQVIVERANCRYGPGEPYLFKYGIFEGDILEIIGRNANGSWIEIRAIGGTNPCWVKASLLDIKGNVMNVAPILPEDVRLPQSPYYGPLKEVAAKRAGNTVTIFWTPMTLRAGDDSGQYAYLVEAWVCQNGKLAFTPVGTYDTSITIQDEPGCSEPSHGRVYGVEKHGYTRWREVPWPKVI